MILLKRPYRVLFVSSSGKVIKIIPFIKSQYESLKPYLQTIDYFTIEGNGLRSYFSAGKKLRILLKENKYDIIHSHWTYSGILCSLLARGEKVIISFMGNDLYGFYSRRYNLLTIKGLLNIVLSQYLLVKVDAVIVKSKRMLRWIPSYSRFKTQVIPNGINFKKFKVIDQSESRKYLNLDQHQKYILFLGDMNDARKNFKLLKKALRLLEESNFSCTLLSPYPSDTSLIPYYLAAADVLAFPSKLEGSPNVIKEALASGCPIVATNVGDIAERIANIQGCFISSFNEYDFSIKLKLAISFGNRINLDGRLAEISEDNIAHKIIKLYDKSLNNLF